MLLTCLNREHGIQKYFASNTVQRVHCNYAHMHNMLAPFVFNVHFSAPIEVYGTRTDEY